jgi:asparaginyl-tRNA synthetase
MSATTVADLLGSPTVDTVVTVEGWIRTARFAKSVTFIHITDGSTVDTLQVVLSPPASPELRVRLTTGAALRVRGQMVPSIGPGQPTELKATEVEVVGDCEASEYPVQKKEASFEFYRTIPHLRVRTAEFQRIFRARSALSAAIHQYFGDLGFVWVHTPIITFSDCEGAGEVFLVGTESKSKSAEMARALGARTAMSDDFFGRQAMLTVSGQLEVEAFACALGRVYTFGPTFRAEDSHTARHASEFWMIEPEIAFATKDEVMDIAEGLVRACATALGSTKIGSDPFARVTYEEAMRLLTLTDQSVTFEHQVGWGHPLQTEHERYLAEVVFKGPVFITDYPVEHKSFYMRLSDDRRTVECFDLLVPGVGEIIGGSAREERMDRLIEQIQRHKIDPAAYEWYIDLRRYGTVPHGGFGLGLERILMWLLDVSNIRDAIPYPRTPA